MTDRPVIRRITRRWAPCSYCGRPIPPGEGRVWHCLRPGKCAAPQHCRRGWHASCLDEKACRRRVVARTVRRVVARTVRRVRAEQLALLEVS